MRKIAIGRRATRDLNRIWDYIATFNRPAADKLLNAIQNAIALLAEFPGMGHEHRGLKFPPYRVWPIESYLIIYRDTSRTLHVVRVIHGARDIEALFPRRRP